MYPTKQEAAWAISNATSGGKPEQIKYLVTEGCIPPLCDLLEVHDAKIVTVALEGLENILKVRLVSVRSWRCSFCSGVGRRGKGLW